MLETIEAFNQSLDHRAATRNQTGLMTGTIINTAMACAKLANTFGGETVFPWNADYTPLRTAHW